MVRPQTLTGIGPTHSIPIIQTTMHGQDHPTQVSTGININHQNGTTNHTTTTKADNTPSETDHEHNSSTNNTQEQQITIVAETLNCHGFAQSSEYVLNRLNHCDILCLTETWIWPHEINLVSNTIHSHPSVVQTSREYTVVSKCGMNDRESDYSGRGYGGVTVIVKNSSNYFTKEIPTASDRIVAVGMYDKNDILTQVICSSYLPFYDGDKTRLAQYIETIDALQTLVDKYACLAPIKILGDFNTQLPTSAKLSKKWHKEKGFTVYSSILYDFLIYNNFTSADLLFKQKVKYTYFCHTSKNYTWIDHILCHVNDMNSTNTCSIVQEEPDNVSDHLPIRLEFLLPLEQCDHQTKSNLTHTAQPNWSNIARNDKYLQIATNKLSQIGNLSIPEN